MRDILTFAATGHPESEHEQIISSIQAGAHDWAAHTFAAGCEVGDMLIARLDIGPEVRDGLRFTFERWNGTGFPTGARGNDIPLAMRIVHLTHDMEAIGRLFSPAHAIEAARDRRDRTYDPALADLFAANGLAWFEQLKKVDPWDAVLGLEPTPHRELRNGALDDALDVVAEFIDLKSPFMTGHSRRCATLATDARQLLGWA